MKVLRNIGLIVTGCGLIYASVKIESLTTGGQVAFSFIGIALIVAAIISLTNGRNNN